MHMYTLFAVLLSDYLFDDKMITINEYTLEKDTCASSSCCWRAHLVGGYVQYIRQPNSQSR